jgi:hypothetical protein
MAAAKNKSSAKRTVKYAAKAQSNAARTATKATQSSAQWAKSGAADWQKGASEWAKQSAKLYQLPFAQGDVGAATKHAAATVQSAGENMMKMSSDMMQQMFGKAAKGGFSAESFNPAAMFQHAPQFKNFDPASAQEKLSSFARESAEHIAKSTGNANRAIGEAMELSRENTEAAVEVTNVAVTVSKELAAELIGYMNKCFAQNVELSKQVLSCRTLNDMFDLSSRIMKTNLDGFFSESVRMSEKLFQCATDVSEPLNERLSATTERLTKAMAA